VQESIAGEWLPGALLCSARRVPDAFTQPAKLPLLQCLMLAFIAIASLATCSTESVQRLIILLAPLLLYQLAAGLMCLTWKRSQGMVLPTQ